MRRASATRVHRSLGRHVVTSYRDPEVARQSEPAGSGVERKLRRRLQTVILVEQRLRRWIDGADWL